MNLMNPADWVFTIVVAICTIGIWIDTRNFYEEQRDAAQANQDDVEAAIEQSQACAPEAHLPCTPFYGSPWPNHKE